MSDSVQWAVLAPVVLVAFLGALQAGLLMHGHNAAAHAAASAAEAESARGAPSGAGTTVALELARAGGLTDVVVRVNRGPAQATVEVTGRRPVLVDWGTAYVSESATAPLEQLP